VIIRSIRVRSYGALRGRAFEGLGRLVAVHGPNEAGKTTLRRFVQDLLFGFHPANVEGHPYASWDGSDPEGSIEIELASGGRAEVERRLGGRPTGTWRSEGQSIKLVNRPIDALGPTQREVFERIYSLERGGLVFPKETWEEMKDRFVGTGGLAGVRPARQVASDLESEGKKLWREDNRGSTRVKEIRERIRALNAEIRDAVGRDAEIRGKEEEIARLAAEREALEEEKTGTLVAIRRTERLLPMRKRFDRIEENERIAGDAAEITGFPEEIENFFRAVDDRIESLSRRLEEERAERGRAVERRDRLTPELRSVLDLADAVELSTDQAAVLGKERADLEDLRSGYESKKAAIREKGRALFERPDTAVGLSSFPAQEARGLIHAFRNARGARASFEAAREAAGALPSPPSLLPLFLSGAGGLALIAASFLAPEGGARLLLLGAGAASLLVVFLFGGWVLGARRRHARAVLDAERREEALEKARREEEARLASVRETLRAAGILPTRVVEPDEALAEDLVDLARALEEKEETCRRIAATEGRIRARESEMLALCGELSIDVADAEEAARRLRRALEEARGAEREHEEAARRIPELDARVKRIEEERERARGEKESAETRLLALGAGDLAACIALLEKRREALRSAAVERRHVEEEVEKRGESIDLLAAEIAGLVSSGGEAPLTDEEKVRLDRRREEIEDRLRAVDAASAALGKEIERLRTHSGVAEIEGEKEAFRWELEEVLARRDRLALLARIVREADARYRAEHEPDIVARAAELFSFVSGGRYERLALDPNEEEIDLVPPGSPDGVAAREPISRGTLDQLFLCLRFALVDHLEAGGESLPLFLDDVLLNWDEERRERGIEIIRRIAEMRQVFFLTCHRDLFRRLAEAGATAVDLPAPDAPEGAAEPASESRVP